ncbi:MAG: hypothetical protein O9972_12930 [Burkholderiales bacterium]|nr:hypothetical protein [Burkholderiales bacterium]
MIPPAKTTPAYRIEDRACGGCVRAIRAAVARVAPMADMETDVAARRVHVEGSDLRDKAAGIRAAIAAARSDPRAARAGRGGDVRCAGWRLRLGRAPLRRPSSAPERAVVGEFNLDPTLDAPAVAAEQRVGRALRVRLVPPLHAAGGLERGLGIQDAGQRIRCLRQDLRVLERLFFVVFHGAVRWRSG